MAGLHGREAELRELGRHRAEVTERTGRAVVIVGGAGIGKSALLRATVDAARDEGVRVLWARGSEAEQAVPYGVIRQLLAPVCGDPACATTAAAERGRCLVVGETLDADADRARLDLCWLVADLAAEHATAVVVDDLHWVDAESVRVLDLLRTRLEDLPILLAVGTRALPAGGWGADASTHQLLVGPLPEEGVRGMLVDELGDAGDDLVAACVEVTGGNPFLVREVASSLRRSDGADVDPAIVRSLVPDAIVRSTSARLLTLGRDAVALAHAASVLGDDSDLHLAARVADLSPAAASTAADLLTAHGVLAPDRPLRFMHPLLLAAVREAISGADRSTLHARAARALHSEPGGLDLACSHLLKADPAGDDEVVELLRRGADDANRRGIPDAAVAYLRRALAEPPAAELEAPILVDLAAAAYTAKSPDALELTRVAIDRATDPASKAAAAISAGHLIALEGACDAAIDLVTEAIADVDVPPAILELGQALALMWSIGTMPARSTTSPLVARARERAAQPDAPAMLRCGAALDGALGDGTAAHIIEVARQSWGTGELARESPPGAPFPQFTIMAAGIAGEMGLVERWSERCLDIAAARGDVISRSVGALWRAWLGEAKGDPAAAVAYALESLELGQDTIAILLPMPVAILGGATLLIDGPAAAADALELLPKRVRGPQFFTSPIWYLTRAAVALAQDRPDDALADLAEVEAWQRLWPAPAGGWSLWHPLAVEAHLALGEKDRAHALASVGIQRATVFGAPRPIARALRAAALTLPLEERAPMLLDALTTTAEGGWCGLDDVECRIDLARSAAACNDLDASTEHLQRAVDDADRSGASALVARVVELAEQLRVPLERRQRLPGIPALTPAERRVVDLAAQDRSNREIAERLFVTEKTVESHLTSSYRKLGIRGREQLAAALAAAGG